MTIFIILATLLLTVSAIAEPFYICDPPPKDGNTWQAIVRMVYPSSRTRTFATQGYSRINNEGNEEWVLFDMDGLPPGEYIFMYKWTHPIQHQTGWSLKTKIIILPPAPTGRLGK